MCSPGVARLWLMSAAWSCLRGMEVMLTALIELLGDFSTAFFFFPPLKKYSLLAKIALGSWFALRMQFAGAGAAS